MADAQDDLLQKLRAKRDGYDQELIWHRFLIDAFTGTGGFDGKVKQPPQSYLGWAADVYSNYALQSVLLGSDVEDFNTYLDRYPREDAQKFRRRIDVSWYPNYVEAILSTMLSYIVKHETTREHIPDKILEWGKNVDGRKTTWDAMLNSAIMPRSALLGWTPVLFDSPALPEGEENATRARTNELGIKPRAMPLFPANLLDFELDDNDQFAWAKLKLCYSERPKPLEAKQKVELYQVWTPETLQEYHVVKVDNEERVQIGPLKSHGFGAVPIVIFRQRPSPEHAVYGLGMVDTVSKMARRLFNLLSELDEILRQCTFPMLQIPLGPNAGGEAEGESTEVVIGVDNALDLPHGSTAEYKWVVPDSSAATVYEARIERIIREIYRAARDEYEDDSTIAESGVARAYKFEKTNTKLGEFAGQLAEGEMRCYQLLARQLGIPDLGEASITPANDFRVEDLDADIKNALDAITLNLPPTAVKLIKRRVLMSMLPNLPKDEMEEVLDELDQQQADLENESALNDEIKQAQGEADIAVAKTTKKTGGVQPGGAGRPPAGKGNPPARKRLKR